MKGSSVDKPTFVTQGLSRKDRSKSRDRSVSIESNETLKDELKKRGKKHEENQEYLEYRNISPSENLTFTEAITVRGTNFFEGVPNLHITEKDQSTDDPKNIKEYGIVNTSVISASDQKPVIIIDTTNNSQIIHNVAKSDNPVVLVEMANANISLSQPSIDGNKANDQITSDLLVVTPPKRTRSRSKNKNKVPQNMDNMESNNPNESRSKSNTKRDKSPSSDSLGVDFTLRERSRSRSKLPDDKVSKEYRDLMKNGTKGKKSKREECHQTANDPTQSCSTQEAYTLTPIPPKRGRSRTRKSDMEQKVASDNGDHQKFSDSKSDRINMTSIQAGSLEDNTPAIVVNKEVIPMTENDILGITPHIEKSRKVTDFTAIQPMTSQENQELSGLKITDVKRFRSRNNGNILPINNDALKVDVPLRGRSKSREISADENVSKEYRDMMKRESKKRDFDKSSATQDVQNIIQRSGKTETSHSKMEQEQFSKNVKTEESKPCEYSRVQISEIDDDDDDPQKKITKIVASPIVFTEPDVNVTFTISPKDNNNNFEELNIEPKTEHYSGKKESKPSTSQIESNQVIEIEKSFRELSSPSVVIQALHNISSDKIMGNTEKEETASISSNMNDTIKTSSEDEIYLIENLPTFDSLSVVAMTCKPPPTPARKRRNTNTMELDEIESQPFITKTDNDQKLAFSVENNDKDSLSQSLESVDNIIESVPIVTFEDENHSENLPPFDRVSIVEMSFKPPPTPPRKKKRNTTQSYEHLYVPMRRHLDLSSNKCSSENDLSRLSREAPSPPIRKRRNTGNFQPPSPEVNKITTKDLEIAFNALDRFKLKFGSTSDFGSRNVLSGSAEALNALNKCKDVVKRVPGIVKNKVVDFLEDRKSKPDTKQVITEKFKAKSVQKGLEGQPHVIVEHVEKVKTKMIRYTQADLPHFQLAHEEKIKMQLGNSPVPPMRAIRAAFNSDDEVTNKALTELGTLTIGASLNRETIAPTQGLSKQQTEFSNDPVGKTKEEQTTADNIDMSCHDNDLKQTKDIFEPTKSAIVATTITMSDIDLSKPLITIVGESTPPGEKDDISTVEKMSANKASAADYPTEESNGPLNIQARKITFRPSASPELPRKVEAIQPEFEAVKQSDDYEQCSTVRNVAANDPMRTDSDEINKVHV